MMYAIANIQGNSFVRWLCKLQIHYTSRFLYKQIKKEILTNWTNLCQEEKQVAPTGIDQYITHVKESNFFFF